MGILKIIFISIGLAMDAFAVSICKGLSLRKVENKIAVIIGGYFGIFQAIMPSIGYFLGISFQGLITSIDHWVAFSLLGIIGGKMVKESTKKEQSNFDDKVDLKTMIVLSIATSIDALAVGITFAFLNVNLILAVLFIGIITFLISFIGVKIGNKVGNKFGNKAEFIGGMVLIIIGFEILSEHLNLI